MGGDSFFTDIDSSTDEGSLMDHATPQESMKPSVSSGAEEGFGTKFPSGSVINGESGSNFRDFSSEAIRNSSTSKVAERQRRMIYAEILRSYEGSEPPFYKLKGAKSKILRYKPGSLTDKASELNVPDATTLLLIGPKGSGKSSLVNKISQAFHDDGVRSAIAQVSYNSCPGDGTYFLNEYMIPKGSGSFCLYDTRSLSFDSSENHKMLERWMTKGVRRGELVERKSDGTVLKIQLKSKALRSQCSSRFRPVNFVIFVVNGISVLESMDGDDERKRQWLQTIVENFNNPLLSYRDDKPVVVLTHGDLLTFSDRVRVRVFLGELLGVHPRTQIFDIPENNGLDTKLEIFDMLLHCLERADRNIPACCFNKVRYVQEDAFLLLAVFVAILVLIIHNFHIFLHLKPAASPVPHDMEWHKIRHLWSD